MQVNTLDLIHSTTAHNYIYLSMTHFSKRLMGNGIFYLNSIPLSQAILDPVTSLCLLLICVF